ncbi:unnamed protein product [Dracunculus medinensis]|uniref:Neur_chan_LBD domain-containing protein n=1 Tax=Dracunculus medinensis TaxID=318479 RepID=A0A0N4U5C5_DRAME|nr:unnamed protein product [Dracunculus medinensis]
MCCLRQIPWIRFEFANGTDKIKQNALFQDQKTNLATLSGYLDASWIDAFAKWNRSNFDDIDRVFIPASWIWKPEFYLYYGYIEGRTPNFVGDISVELNYLGHVRLFVPITARALCPVNVKYFPFDTQNCTFAVSFYFYFKKTVI